MEPKNARGVRDPSGIGIVIMCGCVIYIMQFIDNPVDYFTRTLRPLLITTVPCTLAGSTLIPVRL